MGASQSDGAQAGALVQGAGDDLPQGQGALAVGTQGGSQARALRQLVEHPDRAKAKALAQVQRLWSGGLEGIQILFVFEGQFDGFDFLVGAGGEIGDGTVFDLAVLAIRLAEEDAVIGFAVESGFRAI